MASATQRLIQPGFANCGAATLPRLSACRQAMHPGLDVLDIDAPRHPEAAAWLAARRDRLPVTRTHRTRSGGLHLLFRHRPGMSCWAGRPVAGVDGRASGGYIVWWPAAGELVVCNARPAPWVPWLLAELCPSRLLASARGTIPDSHALASLVRTVAYATEGTRNTITFWAACRAGEMAAYGLLGSETATAVIANAAMQSGLPQAEAERTAWSGVCKGLGSTARV